VEREPGATVERNVGKLDMLAGNGQPGRVKLAEDRITALEKSDIRRGVYDRMVSAVIATVISAAIALHDHFLK